MSKEYINRRQVLKLIGGSLAVGALDGAGLRMGLNLVASAVRLAERVPDPPKKDIPVSGEKLLMSPGWLERRLKSAPEFISAENGLDRMLQAYAEIPVVQETLVHAYDKFLSGENRGRGSSLGDIFRNNQEAARVCLRRNFKTANPESLNFSRETFHLAVIATGIIFNPHTSIGDIRRFRDENGNPPDLSMVNAADGQDIFAMPDIQSYVPDTFPSPKSGFCTPPSDRKSQCAGYHRTAHAFEHFYLTHEYKYLKTYLSETGGPRIPYGAELFLKFFPSLDLQALGLSTAAGFYWEVKETRMDISDWLKKIRDDRWKTHAAEILLGQYRERGKIDISEIFADFEATGLEDPNVIFDFLANFYGGYAGLSGDGNTAIVRLDNQTIYQEHKFTGVQAEKKVVFNRVPDDAGNPHLQTDSGKNIGELPAAA